MSAIVNKIVNFMGFESSEEVEEFDKVSPEKQEKVVKFNNEVKNKKASRLPNQEVEYILLKPNNFEDARRISDEIRAKKIITLNLSALNLDVARRVLDFISGTAYAMDAKLTKVTDDVFTSIPRHVRQINELPIKDCGNELLNKRENEEEEIIKKFLK